MVHTLLQQRQHKKLIIFCQKIMEENTIAYRFVHSQCKVRDYIYMCSRALMYIAFTGLNILFRTLLSREDLCLPQPLHGLFSREIRSYDSSILYCISIILSYIVINYSEKDSSITAKMLNLLGSLVGFIMILMYITMLTKTLTQSLDKHAGIPYDGFCGRFSLL
jgi:hypothetical protein